MSAHGYLGARSAPQVNTAIKRREAVEAVYELQNEFGGAELVKPGRSLVRRLDSAACKLAHDEKGEPRSRRLTLLLLSDVRAALHSSSLHPLGCLSSPQTPPCCPDPLPECTPLHLPRLTRRRSPDRAASPQVLLLADRGFNGKLAPSAWWVPEAVLPAAAADEPGTLRLRMGAETLSFVVPPDGAAEWREGLEKLVKLQSAGGGGAAPKGGMGSALSFHRGASKFTGGAAGGAAGGAGGGGGGTSSGAAQGILAGWLQKKGGGGTDGSQRNWAKGGRRNWKWRWMVVSSDQYITWYANEKLKECKGSLALHGAQVSASDKAGGFWVLTNSRSLEMQADSTEAASRWVAVIQEVPARGCSSSRGGGRELGRERGSGGRGGRRATTDDFRAPRVPNAQTPTAL